MRVLSIEADENLIEDIQQLFPNIKNAADKLAALAFREWVRWLNSSARPMTISDQNIQRIIDLYSEIVENEIPDVRTLYNEFNFPLGQARYLIQAISYRRGGQLYHMALKEIYNAIKEETKVLPDDKPEKTITIKILRTSEQALLDAVLDLIYEDKDVPRPERTTAVGKYVWYKLRTKDAKKIKKNLEKRPEIMEAKLSQEGQSI